MSFLFFQSIFGPEDMSGVDYVPDVVGAEADKDLLLTMDLSDLMEGTVSPTITTWSVATICIYPPNSVVLPS